MRENKSPLAKFLASCFQPSWSSQLSDAAASNDVELAKLALEQDPLLVVSKGRGGLQDTALHLAASKGHVEILKLLLSHVARHLPLYEREVAYAHQQSAPWPRDRVFKVVVNQLNIKGQTPLMFACYAGQAECVRVLIEYGADPWVHDYAGRRTALHYAALHGHATCISAVLDNLHPDDLVRVPPRRRRVRSVHMLVNQGTSSGFTPLHFAVYSKKPGTMKALLERGANPVAVTVAEDVNDIVKCPRWTTPLHVAGYNGFTAGAKELLAHYLSTRETANARDPRRFSDRASRLPHHVAGLHGHRQLAQMLRPSYNLANVFAPGEVQPVGVQKLAVIASQALQMSLLAQVEAADVKLGRCSGTTDGGDMSEQGDTLVGAETGLPSTSRRHSLQGTHTPPVAHTQTHGASTGATSSSGRRSFTQVIVDRVRRSFGGRPSDAGRHSEGAAGAAAAPGAAGADTGPEATAAAAALAAQAPHTSRRVSADQATWWEPAAAPADDAPEITEVQVIDAPVPSPRVAERATHSPRPSQSGGILSLVRRRSHTSRHRLGGQSHESIELGCADPPQPALAPQPEVPAATSPTKDAGSPALWTVSSEVPVNSDGLPLGTLSKAGWGSEAMLATLPAKETCAVCLEDTHALVLQPCLHRLCADCSRQMIMSMKDKPMLCPVCRVNTRGFCAPSDQPALTATRLSMKAA